MRTQPVPMGQRQRKLMGTVLLVILLIAYPLLSMVLYSTFLAASPWWGAILYAAAVGFLWLVPAMAIIRWMVRP
jgi:hypothetical protein